MTVNPLVALGPRDAGPAGGAAVLAGAGTGPAPGSATPGFMELLNQAVQSLETSQLAADQAGLDLLVGRAADLAQVMLASERATLSLQLAIQVRNKVLEAYQEIMRMQV